jgi:hypothetical protein
MKPRPEPHGQVRRSQVLTTYGPGSLIDFPNDAILMGGIDTWGDPIKDQFQEIFEDRLLATLRQALSVPGLRLFSPPTDTGEEHGFRKGITAYQFPEWFVVQTPINPDSLVRSRPLVHRDALTKKRYTVNGKKYPVVPIRFVQACINGHISDIDWFAFAHRGKTDCRAPLLLEEHGTSGDLADLFVRCTIHGPGRSLVDAKQRDNNPTPLGLCQGKRPWLGAYSHEVCGGEEGPPQPNRLLVRSASNAYFSQTVSAISIPEGDVQIRKAIEEVWSFVEIVETLKDLRHEMKRAAVKATLGGFAESKILAEIQRKKSGTSAQKGIKQAELETLLACDESTLEDIPEADFYARAWPLKVAKGDPTEKLEKVVLVHRLREVIVQVGFTRLEPATRDVDAELELGVRSAVLAKELSWLPAVENRGEGIFLAFKREAIESWAGREEVIDRAAKLRTGFDAWAKGHSLEKKAKFPGATYVLLHSLSHLLITAVSLECGYAASSIRERIYVNEGDGAYGILLYTGTPDAEGTLGGLVEVGKKIDMHLRNALEMARLCSNDPVCSQHEPESRQEERFLHGAACHGCLLISEPSCEWRNEYLDRALVVATVQDLGAEFFQDA